MKERAPLAMDGGVDVHAIEPGPGLTLHQVIQRRPLQKRDQRGHEEEERQNAVVEREDAQQAPHVKVAEIGGLVTGIVKDTGDEEAGQDEEQVDAVGSRSPSRTRWRARPSWSGACQPMKWSSRTIRMAKPRTPSSAGMCPCRLGGGLALAGAADIAPPP